MLFDKLYFWSEDNSTNRDFVNFHGTEYLMFEYSNHKMILIVQISNMIQL